MLPMTRALVGAKAGAGGGGGASAAVWDSVTANAVYSFANGGLDASKTSGDNTWGDSVSVTVITLTSVDKYEIDIEAVTRETSARDNFGILKTSDVGTVSGGGFLSEDVAGRHYGKQPGDGGGPLADGGIVTIRFDGPNSELKVLVNNVQFSTTISIDNTQSYYFTLNNYRTGNTTRIREEIYAPAAGFTKLTA